MRHRVTRKLLKESQHQVALLANENRQLNGVRERAVMPAWSNATLAANLVEFKDTQVSWLFYCHDFDQPAINTIALGMLRLCAVG